MRLEGISTPVARLILLVWVAATAIIAIGSAATIWLSSNQAVRKPSCSARTATFQPSAPRATHTLMSMSSPLLVAYGCGELRLAAIARL
jgi:hypothetical protein